MNEISLRKTREIRTMTHFGGLNNEEVYKPHKPKQEFK